MNIFKHSLCVLILVMVLADGRAATQCASSLDGGGQRAGAGEITLDGSAGGIGSYSTAGVVVGKGGYAGQLYDLKTIQVSASPTNVNEGATRQLVATAVNDDDTFGSLPGTPAWGVNAGPLTGVDGVGLATADTVYQDTAASAYAAFSSVTGTVGLVVLNTGNDDYGIYAGDQIADTWQVQHFGVGNPDGGPGGNPDSDLMDNLSEYIADTDPTNELSILHIAGIEPQGGNVLISWAGGIQSTQYLERCSSLTNGPSGWVVILTNAPPTALSENHPDSMGGGPYYYRIRAAR